MLFVISEESWWEEESKESDREFGRRLLLGLDGDWTGKTYTRV